MTAPKPPPKTRLICGMIAAGAALLDRAADALADAFGPVAATSGTTPFDFTEYYAGEMGPGLLRRFAAFEGDFPPGTLADAKLRTNALEAEFAADAADPPRPVNLDPGYVETSKLVLASMKNFAHRIYLRDGVYAEITLQWRKGWQALPWTFPDYASGRYDPFLTRVRETLR